MSYCSICDFHCKKEIYFKNHVHINLDKEYCNSLNFEDIKFIYVHIPKNAGTTIKYRLKKLCDCVILNKPKNLNDYKDRIINLNHLSFNDSKFKNKLICFVRNPYTRFVSMFYYHKLHKKYNSINEFIKKIYNNKKIYNFIKNNDSLDQKAKFDFLKTPRGTNVAYSWKNQCAWIPDNIFFLGKIENLEDDFKKLCNKLNCEYKYKNIKSNKNRYVKKDKLNEDLKKKIYDLYENDFKKFDYKF